MLAAGAVGGWPLLVLVRGWASGGPAAGRPGRVPAGSG